MNNGARRETFRAEDEKPAIRLGRVLGFESKRAGLACGFAREKAEDPSHGDLVFLGRTRCDRRLLSTGVPVPSPRLSAISARPAGNPGVDKVIAYTPMDAMGSPFSTFRQITLETPTRSTIISTVKLRLRRASSRSLRSLARERRTRAGRLLPGSHGKVLLESP
jgi:hypothetical protein